MPMFFGQVNIGEFGLVIRVVAIARFIERRYIDGCNRTDGHVKPYAESGDPAMWTKEGHSLFRIVGRVKMGAPSRL
jgi:hypothetical protein